MAALLIIKLELLALVVDQVAEIYKGFVTMWFVLPSAFLVEK